MVFPLMEDLDMNAPEWLKPAAYGAIAGAIALAVAGFSWGGWVTGGTADKMAAEQARSEVVAALVPICLEQSKADPQVAETMTQLKAASRYKRSGMVMEAGWATIPGSEDPNRAVASACMEKLAEQF